MKLFSLLGAFMASSLVAAGKPEPETRLKPTYTPPYTETTTTHTWTRPTKTETEYKTKIYVKPSVQVLTETETEYRTKHHHTKQTVVSVQSVETPHPKPHHHTNTITVIGSKTYPVYVPTETPAVTAGAAGRQAAGAMVVLGGVAAFLL
ncbi:hypothetical protein QBC41DRAFT_237715 [Cercophora samala]|uniref:Uncharacterized protein n=1 Tax=Cercophora samala TaxID=330535 RepID=A0AA39YUP1_9PEZI|nr:hypothetical protein QBC41DRAFT_237715 [Cercophora samala]